jgi:dUTP pyrophosphatase
MIVSYQKLRPGTPDLEYRQGYGFSCAADLTAMAVQDEENHIIFFTGIAIEIPVGYVGLLFPRSSAASTDLILGNCVGLIDSDYRGEIKLVYKDIFSIAFLYRYQMNLMKNISLGRVSSGVGNEILETLKRYKIGDRIGQLLILPIPEVEYRETDKLNLTERQNGGFGSTGR